MPTKQYWGWWGVVWDVENIDHPLINGTIGLWVDLRWETLLGKYARAALNWDILADDIILARDHFSPYAPTVLLRKHWKWYILFVSDDGMFVEMDSWGTFDSNDN